MRDDGQVATPEHPDAQRPEVRLDPAHLAPVLLTLLDELRTTMFCVKDAQGRYVTVNPTFVRRAGRTSRRDVLGRRAEDLFVPDLAERYAEQDARVLAGTELRHELELIRALGPGEAAAATWHLTTKLPVRDGEGRVVGVVSVSQDLGEQRDAATFPAVARVIDHIAAHVADPPSAADLAAIAGTSTTALSRRLRRVTGLSTTQLVLRTRIDAAARLLATTATPIADIAHATGFYDQAAFSRQFARLAGETPAQFRRRERRTAPTD